MDNSEHDEELLYGLEVFNKSDNKCSPSISKVAITIWLTLVIKDRYRAVRATKRDKEIDNMT